ncbi:cation efflux protein [Lichtheimia hyalospora FSU 10163]|nr:cation efflux protein [Lichtheimia hyalospora FSU 10163]
MSATAAAIAIRIPKRHTWLAIASTNTVRQPCYRQRSAYYTATAAITLLRRTHKTHSGASHDHHHHVDLLTTMQQSGQKGMRITIIGLASNVGLTVTKGVTGWAMNSAALLADAAHSLSDLLGDFVTLYTYKMSKRPPDALYPYGYGKYETIGSLALSSLLIAGAVGIGVHSIDLLQTTLTTLYPATQSSAAVAAATTTTTTTAAATAAGVMGAATNATPAAFAAIPSMTGETALNPNAAWFAAASVLIKEWLYRKTLKVAREERSEVLVANAWHHRTDALSSAVVMFAIVGSYAGLPVLDPLGGLVVAGMIFKSSIEMTTSSLKELADRSIDADDLDKVKKTMMQMKRMEPHIIDFHSLRGRKLGPYYQLDMALKVPPHLSVLDAQCIEQRVRSAVHRDCEHVQQVLVRLET